LVEQFTVNQAAQLLDARMTRFQLSDVLRRTQAGDGAISGDRKRRQVGGPDAVFNGQLQIADPVAFAALVARGVGRHRAFGFGMLLLKPPARVD
jgi:CRISPR system Cascade subunit CasE